MDIMEAKQLVIKAGIEVVEYGLIARTWGNISCRVDDHDVLAAMWEVAYADGERSADEETLVRLVAGLLGINDRDSGLARQRALDDMGLNKA